MFHSKLLLSLLLAAIGSMPALPVATAAGTSSCWPSSAGISANWGPLADLHIDATAFCNHFSSNDVVKITSGRFWFGWQTAMFVGTFTNTDSCLASFNQIISDCYGKNPSIPATMGGSITDSGGANLVISFGDKAKLGI